MGLTSSSPGLLILGVPGLSCARSILKLDRRFRGGSGSARGDRRGDDDFRRVAGGRNMVVRSGSARGVSVLLDGIAVTGLAKVCPIPALEASGAETFRWFPPGVSPPSRFRRLMLPVLESQLVGELKCNDLDRLGSLDGVFSKGSGISLN